MNPPCAAGILLIFIAGAASVRAGTVFRVSTEGSADNAGTGWGAPTTLDSAFSRAQSGDEIWLRKGTYHPGGGAVSTEVTFSLPAGVSVYGGFAGTETERGQRDITAWPAVLSGDFGGDDVPLSPFFSGIPSGIIGTNARYVVTFVPGETGSVLDGLAVRGGGVKIEGGTASLVRLTMSIAGGVIVSNAESFHATGCTFRDMVSTNFGGAVSVTNTAACHIAHCDFTRNRGSEGAGLYLTGGGTATVTACRFDQNEASDQGGAVHVSGLAHAAFTGCSFTNSQLHRKEDQFGGGLWAANVPDLIIRESLFVNNEADAAGAMDLYDCTVTMDRVLILPNSDADVRTSRTNVTATNCVFDGDISVREASSFLLLNATNGNFRATGASSVIVRNSILGILPDIDAGSSLSISHSIVPGGAAGPGNIDADPFLADGDYAPGTDLVWGTSDDVFPDLRLKAGSPAIDAGLADAALPLLDYQGLRRQIGPVDIGAYEFTADPAAFDGDGDGQPDILESTAGTNPFDAASIFTTANGITDGKFRLQWSPAPGRTYEVESSTDLAGWNTAATFLSTDTGLFEAPLTGKGFYRLRVRRGF